MTPTAVVRPLPGPGLVARSGQLLLVCADGAAGVEELLGLVAEVSSAGGDGSVLVRRVAALLAADFAGRYPACAACGPTSDGRLAVLVHGSALATVVGGDGEVTLSAADAITSVNRLVAGPVSAVRLELPGAGAANALARLEAGVITAAGVVTGEGLQAAGGRTGWTPPAPAPPVEAPAPAVAPAQQAPAHDSPAYDAPAYEPPAYQPPAYEAPAYEAPVHEAPAYEPPAYQAPASSSSIVDSNWPPVAPPDLPVRVPAEPPAPPSYTEPSYTPPFYPAYGASEPAAEAAPLDGDGWREGPSLREPAPSAPFVSVPLGGADTPGAPPPVTDGRPLVLGLACVNGHLTDPSSEACLTCGASMLGRPPVLQEGPRPPLGALLLDDGSAFVLDVDYVLGREPQQDPEVVAGTVRPLKIADADGVVSRKHVRVALVGWEIQVVDLGSANGTFVQYPGDPTSHALAAHQPVVVKPGTQVTMGRRWFRVEALSPETPAG